MKIVFTQSDRWGAKLIRWFTKSEWSHCLIALDDDLEGENLVFESTLSGGVKLSLWSRRNDKKRAIYNIKGQPSIKPLYPYLGKNYGYLQILGYPIAKLFKLKYNPFKKDYVCSEIVLRFLLENNYKEFNCLDLNTATPEDIYKILSKSPNFTLLNVN
jgi:hypothetical protein